LNVVDSPDEARAFVREKGWRWPQIRDPARVLAKRFGVQWQPALIAIDARGRLVGIDQSRSRERGWNRLAARLP
jgi:hypothetical protein